MKETHLLTACILSAALTISNANQFTPYVLPDNLDLSRSPPYFPMNHFYGNILFDPRLNPYSLGYYSNYEAERGAMERREENIGTNVNTWGMPHMNGQQIELPQTQISNDPFVLPRRGFPISSVYIDMVKGTRHEIPTEVPINPDNISFGPSASQVAIAPKEMKLEESHINFSNLNHNKEHRHEHVSKTVENLEPKEMSKVTAHKKKVVENIPDYTTTTEEQVSTSTLKPVPTLSPWLDGFGK